MNSVMAITSSDKVKRDNDKRMTNSYADEKRDKAIFREILNQRVEERKEAPRECHTLTYGQDCRLHAFLYQQREYHY